MKFSRYAAALAALLAPALAAAHEVYVLPPATVAQAIATPAFSEWHVLLTNLHTFIFWAFMGALTVFVVFFASIIRPIERVAEPVLKKLPPYAPAIGRITVGLSFLMGAYYGAFAGPELPLPATFGAYAQVASVLMVLAGLMFLFGVYARAAALIGFGLFAVEIAAHGIYMLTYTNYFADFVLVAILGAHSIGMHTRAREETRLPHSLLRLKKTLMPFVFPVLRIGFGLSLLYASLYAKIIHNNLALDVAYAYPPLVHFFGFEPHFLVLGAAIIEILIALFFILGIEIRFTSLFLLFWLSLSLWYFGEVVWPHLILIGIPIAFICYGYDKYSLEGAVMKRYHREPVL